MQQKSVNFKNRQWMFFEWCERNPEHEINVDVICRNAIDEIIAENNKDFLDMNDMRYKNE